MLDRVIRELGETLRGIAAAVRARKTLFAAVTAGVFVMDIVVPPAVLSLSRKPVDYFTFNPWLAKLPEYLSSGPGSLGQRLEKVWSLALFWFSSDNPFGVEWGFAVTVGDLARFLLMSLLVGAYFTLWVQRRAQLGGHGWAFGAGGQGGVLGAFSRVFGLATGGCTVTGLRRPLQRHTQVDVRAVQYRHRRRAHGDGPRRALPRLARRQSARGQALTSRHEPECMEVKA